MHGGSDVADQIADQEIQQQFDDNSEFEEEASGLDTSYEDLLGHHSRSYPRSSPNYGRGGLDYEQYNVDLADESICCVFVNEKTYVYELVNREQCKRMRLNNDDRSYDKVFGAFVDDVQTQLVYPNIFMQKWTDREKFSSYPGIVVANEKTVVDVQFQVGYEARRILRVGQRARGTGHSAYAERQKFELLFHKADGYYLDIRHCKNLENSALDFPNDFLYTRGIEESGQRFIQSKFLHRLRWAHSMDSCFIV